MKKLLTLSLFSLLSLTAFASDDHHGHNHEASVEPAPHGGILRDAPPYKAELVLDKEKAKIFLYSKNGDKLEPAVLEAKELKGNIRFPKDKKEKPVVFKKSGESFDATIKGIAKAHRYDMHVNLEEKGKKTLIDFGVDNIH